MKTSIRILSRAALWGAAFLLSTLLYLPSTALAQTTAFTHQGFLTIAGSPANGPSDLTFTLFDAASGGTPVGTSNVVDDLNLTNGLYTVQLDFGAGSLVGARWLEMAVRPGASTDAYTNLAPRVVLTTVPYAAAAGTADTVTGTVNAAQLTGTIASGNIAAGTIGTSHLAANAVQSANIATGAVGTQQLAAFAVTGDKLRFGVESGTENDGVISPGAGTLAFTRTFAYPFTEAPSVTVLSGSWTAGAVTVSNFSASLPFTPATLDSNNIVGLHTSLAIIDGHPAISYFLQSSNDLTFIRATDAAGTSWGVPVVVDTVANVGHFTSLAVVNGNPAISYRAAGTAGDLKYVRATDAAGTGWGTPVTVDSADDVGTYTSLAVVNGNPAISYYDVTNGDLKYVRATNPDGTAWGTPVTVDSTGDVGQYTTLRVVNGLPSISYYDVSNGDLKYVRAANPDGTTWGAPVTVDSANNVGQYASMALVNGRPAIGYRDNTTTDLKYVRASNPDGTAWGTPVIVDPSGLANYISLAEVNGGPAISYQRGGGVGDLRFVSAKDEDGTAWGTPVTLDSFGTVGQYTSLRQVNGSPAISYYDLTNGDLKFAVIPELGMLWQARDGTVAPLVATTVAAGAIGTSQLAANAVQSGNIAAGTVLPTQNIVGTVQIPVANTSYTATSASPTVFDLTSATASVGDVVQITGAGAGGWIANVWQPDLWTARENNRLWQSVASSADGSKLVAVVYGGQIYTSTDFGVSWTARENNRSWQSVASSADGSKLVAVVQGGQVYTSTDSGVSWTARESNRYWSSVASSADGSKLVAVVYGDQIYTSTDFGVSWTAQGSNRQWVSVASSADGSKLVAVVYGGQVYTSTDSGVSWTARESSRNWYAVASSADGSKLVAVVQNGQIYTSTDSGVNWTARESSRNWHSVASSADGSKLVAVVQNGQIYTSTDSGVSWTARESNRSWQSVASSADGSKLVAAVSFPAGRIYTSSVAVASGAQGTAASLQYLGGGEWTVVGGADGAVTSAQLADGAITSAKIAAGAVGSAQLAANAVTSAKIAAGAVQSGNIASGAVTSANIAAGTVLPTQSIAGTTLIPVANTSYTATSASPTVFDLTSATASVGDVVQITGAGAGGWSASLYQPDTWTARESNRYWSSVASSADGTKLVAVEDGGQIYISTDSGVSWTARESNRGWYSVASSADGGKLVAVVYGGQIYTSTDSGVNWTARESSRAWSSVASSSDGSKLVAVVNGGQIYTSTDSGVSWGPRQSSRGWQSVASSADGSKLVAVVYGGQVYTSTDSGVSWTARESSRDWNSVASSANGSKLVAVVYGGQIYTSTDSGVSWTARESNRVWYSVASSSDGSKLVAVEPGGQIYTSTDSGVSWTARESNRNWYAVASSADGSKLVAVVQNGQIYTSGATVASGAQGTAATLQYLGGGEWTVVGGADGAVGSAQLAANAVQTANIATGAVMAANLDPSIGLWTASGTNVYRSGGNVGIGTASPRTALEIKGASAAGPSLRLTGVGGNGSKVGLELATYDPVSLGTTNPGVRIEALDANYSAHLDFRTKVPGAPTNALASRLFIQNDGNVGIGTTNPAAKLDINGLIKATDISINDTNGSFGVPFYPPSGNAGLAALIAGTGTYEPQMRFARGDGEFFDIGMNGNNGFTIEDNDTPRLTINSSGNVGIGTSTPAASLHLQGGGEQLRFSKAAGGAYFTQIALSDADPNIFVINSHGDSGTYGAIQLATGDVLRMTIGSPAQGGYVGIGTASPESRLHVHNGNLTVISDLAWARFKSLSGVTILKSEVGFPLYVNASVGSILRSDSLAFWDVPSDRRLKTGIEPVAGALETLRRINPVRFHYTKEHLEKMEGATDAERLGVIAQEFQQVFPQYVREGKDGYLSVQADPLMYVNAAAIKELNAKHEAAMKEKNAEIAELKRKDAAMEQRLGALEKLLNRLSVVKDGGGQ